MFYTVYILCLGKSLYLLYIVLLSGGNLILLLFITDIGLLTLGCLYTIHICNMNVCNVQCTLSKINCHFFIDG